MAADVKRLPCLKLILIGILFYMLICVSSAQRFMGSSRFPSRLNPRTGVRQRSRTQFRPRTIRIQNPPRNEFATSSFRPIRTQRTFVDRNEIRTQPIRTQRTFADRNGARPQPIRTQRIFADRSGAGSQLIRTQRTFTDRGRVQPRPVSFQTPRLGEVRVPSVQRSRIPVRDTNQGPVQVRSGSQNPRQIQRMQAFNDHLIGRREQLQQQFFDRRQQQFSIRSAAAAGGSRQPDFTRRQMTRQFPNLGEQNFNSNNNGNLQTRRLTGLPRLSVSQNSQQPVFRVQQASTRRSHTPRTPAMRQRELIRRTGSTNTPANVNTKEKQPQVVVSQKRGQQVVSQQQQHQFVSPTQKRQSVVSRVQPNAVVSHRQQPMVLARKHLETIASKRQLPVGTNQQPRVTVSQPQFPVVPKQQPQATVSQMQPQTIVSHREPQAVLSKGLTVPIRSPEVQSPTLQVGQIVQAVAHPAVTVEGTVVSQPGIVQNLLPVQNTALQPGTIQYVPTVGNAIVQPAATAPATAGTSDLVFEELVNAFTNALQNPTSQQTQVGQTVPAVQIHNQHPQMALQNTIQLQSQPAIHQHGGIIQHGGIMQHGGMMQHGAFGGHMHGNPFGLMNPWMMGRMNPSMMQELMFGDTTDPPDPIATTTTTVAPVTVAAPVAGINKTAVVAPLDTSAAVSAAGSAAVASAVGASAIITAAVDPVTVVKPVDASKTVTIVQAEVAKPVNTLNVVPITIKEAPVVSQLPKADSKTNAEVIPKIVVDVPLVPGVPAPSQGLTNLQQHQNEAVIVDTINKNVHPENKAIKTTSTKAPLTFEEKLMAEVNAMLANTSVDMTMLSQVVGHVASELNGAAIESIPSAVQLGLKTLVPDPSAKKLSKKEIVSELIGSTRGVVVYPPTPPSVTVVERAKAVKPEVIVKTKKVDSHTQASDVVKNVSSTNVLSEVPVVKEKAKTSITPTTKIPPHLEIPTLPPKTGSMAESPEVYRTLQTILDHNPSAIVKVLEETAIPKVETPPGPKISVKSLVDTDRKSNFPNLQSILTDISTAVEVKTKNLSSSGIAPLSNIEIKVEPLKGSVNTTNGGNTSALIAAEPKMNDIRLQPIIDSTTLQTTANYNATESFSSEVPTMPTIPVDIVVSTDPTIPTATEPTIPTEIMPTWSSQAFTETGSTFGITYPAWTETNAAPFVDISTTATTDVTGSSVSGKIEGVPVNISENVNKVTPKMANMEGIPVHVERVPTTVYPIDQSTSAINLDATGALAILQEIRSFNPNTTTSGKHDDIARKLADPNFVSMLRGLLQTMMNKVSVTATTPLWTEIPDISTTSFPISSTEEYEAEDFITETPAP